MKIKEVSYRKSFQVGTNHVTLELTAEVENEKAADVVDKLRAFVSAQALKEVPVSSTDLLNQKIQAQRVPTS
jgi:hypothetical protein